MTITNSKSIIKTVSYDWSEVMRENNAVIFRVICRITTHTELTVEGSQIFTLKNIFDTDEKNDLALTSESSAYNNAVQCLTAALAYSNQTLLPAQSS